MNYYSFHIGDYASHTRHLSLLEDLAYRRLLDSYYLSEKPIFGTIENIAKEIGMASQIEEVKYVLNKFFTESNIGWSHIRCDEEIAKYQEKQKLASKAGKASVLARMNKSLTSVKQPLNKKLTSVQPTNNQEPITNNQKKNIVARPEGLSDMVWSDYLTLRNKKRSPLTQTALEGLQKQAKLANMTLEEVLRTCSERGWIGFRAEWIKDSQNKKELPLGNEQQIAYAYAHECGGDPTKARFNSYWEMRDFILKFRDKKKNA